MVYKVIVTQLQTLTGMPQGISGLLGIDRIKVGMDLIQVCL